MKNVSFKSAEDESKFKKFVCENKEVIDTFLTLFIASVKNPIVKFLLSGIVEALKHICKK